MAQQTIGFLISPSVSVTNGSKTVTLTGNADAYHVYNGTVVFIGNYPPVEAVLGTVPDVNGNSIITLKEIWDNPTVAADPLVAFNTNEGLPEAIRSLREIQNIYLTLKTENESLLTGTTSTVSIDINGVPTNFTPYQYLVNQFNASQSQIDSLVGSVQAITKTEFDAIAESNKRLYNGSGFVEMGKHIVNAAFPPVNDGMWTENMVDATDANILHLGRYSPADQSDSGRTYYPVANVDGVLYDVISKPDTGKPYEIKFPDAPDGLQKLNGTLPDYEDLSAAIVAGGTSLSQSVITRQDPVLLRIRKGVDISVEDAVFQLGNRQFGATSYDGIALSNTNTSQAESAFFPEDTATKGYSLKWSTASDADKTTFIQDAKNKIYSDDGVLKQDQYQILVHKGLREYDDLSDAMTAFGYTQDATDKGLWTDGTDLFIPITRVQRLNQGAYQKTHNPYGCAVKGTNNGLTNGATSTSDAFVAKTGGNIISISSGRPTNSIYLYHDAIYAGLVHDSRSSARDKSPQELFSIYDKKAKAGDIRGREKAPYQTSSVSSAFLTAEFETLPYQSIFATDAVFDATFPSGVVGKKEATAPDGITDLFPVTDKKIIGTPTALRSTDNGATWTSFTPTFDSITNTFTFTNEPATNIVLVQYDTKASPYTAFSGVIKQKGTAVLATNDKASATLVQALIGNVPVGSESELLTVLSDKDNLLTYQTKTITDDVIAASAITTLNSQYYLAFWPDNAGVIDYDDTTAIMTQLPFFTGEA